MNADFQDSDDDVFWGPITLKEKKRDVLRKVPVKYIKSRSSVSTNPSFIDDKPLRFGEIITCDLPPYHSHSTSQEKEIDLMVTADEGSCDNTVKEEISTSYHSLSSTNSSFFQDVINISSEKESSIIKNDSNVDFDNKQEEHICDIPKLKTQSSTGKDFINYFNNLDITEQVKLTPLEEIEELMEESKAESSSSDASFKFNDTLEEMDRFMMYGQDYRMSYEIHDNINSISNKSVLKEGEVEATKTHFTKPTGIPILTRSVTKTPINKQINQINLKKSGGKNRFKDIQSPVAMYIKHSGHTPLFKTLTPGNINKENIPESRSTTKVKSNLDTFTFPAVCYKPAKTKKIIEEEFKLPNNISTLIPLKAKVGVHQRKGRQLEMIVDGDLTLADNTLNCTKDISVVEKKIVFM